MGASVRLVRSKAPSHGLAIVMATCALMVSACTAGPVHGARPGAAQSVTTPADPERIGMPQPGTCWRVAQKHFVASYWVDDSPQVPCTTEHTTQTALAFTVPQPTVAMAKTVADQCRDHVRTFVGVDVDHWIPWNALVFLPSRRQIDAGASWVRCDVGIPVHPKGSHQVSLTRSVENAAISRPADLMGCTNRLPRARSTEAWHQCGSTHRYEETGTLAELTGLTHYPSAARLERQGAHECRLHLSRELSRRGASALAVWDPPGGLAGGELFGSCWAYDPGGRSLPPRP